MHINITTLGLIFTAFGALILFLNNIFTGWHQRAFGEKEWWKRYWWMGWRPLIRITHPSGKIERRIKWNRKVITSGFLPPKYQFEVIGFLYILIGTILQMIGL